jgi:hypothetical protein
MREAANTEIHASYLPKVESSMGLDFKISSYFIWGTIDLIALAFRNLFRALLSAVC